MSNIQGDIVAITDSNGNIVVEYLYDSWGKLISITGSLANTVGIKNPYRYRGYYYDTETGLYYLNSRCYDPTIKRFINADEFVTLAQYINDSNMFAYCLNNPIRFIDVNGCYVNPFDELTWPGEIHKEVQKHIMANYPGAKIEQCCSAGFVDVVIYPKKQCYEVKPVSYNNPEKHQRAVEQLERYLNTERFKEYSPGSEKIAGIFQYKNYNVTYWSTGDGIILYTFISRPEKVPKPQLVPAPYPEKSYSYAKSASAQKVAVALTICAVMVSTGGGHSRTIRSQNSACASAY